MLGQKQRDTESGEWVFVFLHDYMVGYTVGCCADNIRAMHTNIMQSLDACCVSVRFLISEKKQLHLRRFPKCDLSIVKPEYLCRL